MFRVQQGEKRKDRPDDCVRLEVDQGAVQRGLRL